MKKITLSILAIIILVIVIGASYVKLALPNVGAATNLHVSATPERVKHGEYLANHVSLCMDCHSTRDWSKFSGPKLPGTEGKGGEVFNEKVGFPGTFYSKNITPSGLKSWSDGEIFRTITTGVDKNGKALFPVMPYIYYGKMDKEDIYDIIAYIRTLTPIDNKIAERSIKFPMNFIINTIPQKASFVTKPSSSDTVLYGGYLVKSAACIECHTQVKKGQIIPELAFAGGREFDLPGGKTLSANITPDNETGIGNWPAEQFIAKFKSYTDPVNIVATPANTPNTVMPWTMFAGMDTADLRSIYAYLKTLKPIRNEVIHFNRKEVAVK